MGKKGDFFDKQQKKRGRTPSLSFGWEPKKCGDRITKTHLAFWSSSASVAVETVEVSVAAGAGCFSVTFLGVRREQCSLKKKRKRAHLGMPHDGINYLQFRLTQGEINKNYLSQDTNVATPLGKTRGFESNKTHTQSSTIWGNHWG